MQQLSCLNNLLEHLQMCVYGHTHMPRNYVFRNVCNIINLQKNLDNLNVNNKK